MKQRKLIATFSFSVISMLLISCAAQTRMAVTPATQIGLGNTVERKLTHLEGLINIVSEGQKKTFPWPTLFWVCLFAGAIHQGISTGLFTVGRHVRRRINERKKERVIPIG